MGKVINTTEEEFKMEKSSIGQNMETLFTQLEKFLKTETVVGEPMTIGEVTIVPLITVSFGCGMGGGTGKDSEKSEEGSGSGLGAGAKISPDSVLVINKGEVTMMPVKGKANLEKLMEKVPDIVSQINIKGEKESKAKSESE